MYSGNTYDNWLQRQIDIYNGDVQEPISDDEWLDYYEESGIMKDYCDPERQAERDEMLLWQ